MSTSKIWNPLKDKEWHASNKNTIRSWVWRNMRVFDGIRTLPHKMALEVEGGKITHMESEFSYSKKYPDSKDIDHWAEDVQLAGQDGVITPGFVDCHTHILYAGTRLNDFILRIDGASYEKLAETGGILRTLYDTRAASEDELLHQSLPRLDALIKDGVTTIEIKSGYGLSLNDELKMLRVARQMEKLRKVRVITTLLAAHAVPPEYQDRGDDYIDLICQEILPAAVEEKLVDMVDVFCEKIAFSPARCEKVFQAAQKYHLPIKAHAEQLSNLGGAALAAQYGALSVDHIEYLDENGIKAMKKSGTVAVLLPGAFYTLRENQLPPIELLRQHKIPIALATGANPGSSPIFMPSLILNMACTLFNLTTKEALSSFTVHAAKALGLEIQGIGHLKVGNPADFCVWDINYPADLCYAIQPGRLRQRVFNGVPDNVCR